LSPRTGLSFSSQVHSANGLRAAPGKTIEYKLFDHFLNEQFSRAICVARRATTNECNPDAVRLMMDRVDNSVFMRAFSNVACFRGFHALDNEKVFHRIPLSSPN
jgi:hypothetical protein